MRQPKYIYNLRVGILLFFLVPLKSFSQDISGVWVGYMYNDTTKQTIHYELAINDINGKASGFSHTTFVIDSIKNIGVKEVKVKVKNEKVFVEDEKFVYDNYTEPPAKGVKMFSFLTLSQNDTAQVLSGIWRTNATKLYNPLTGSVFLEKKKKVEPRQTIIVKKLTELGLDGQLAFLPPDVSKNNVAVNQRKENQLSSVSTSGDAKKLTTQKPAEKKVEVASANNNQGNEQPVAVKDGNTSLQKEGSQLSSISSSGNEKQLTTQKPAEKKVEIASANNSKGNKQPVAVNDGHSSSQPLPPVSSSGDEKQLTTQKPAEKKVEIASENNNKENEQSVAVNDGNSSSQPLPSVSSSGEEKQLTTQKPAEKKVEITSANNNEGYEQSVVANDTNSSLQKNSQVAISAPSDKRKQAAKTETSANAKNDLANKQGDRANKETLINKDSAEESKDANMVAINQNRQISQAPANNNASQASPSSATFNEKAQRQPAVNVSQPNSQPVFDNADQKNIKRNNEQTVGTANESNLKVRGKNKNASAGTVVMSSGNNSNTLAQSPGDNNSGITDPKKNEQDVANISQQNKKMIVGQTKETDNSSGGRDIAVSDNNTSPKNNPSQNTEAVNQQIKAKINPVENQQKLNSLQPAVVVKPKVIAPVAAADLSKRKLETIRTVEIAQDSLVFSLYDNGSIDGDTVSVLLNGKVIMPRVGLLATAISKTIYLTPDMGDSISVVMYAENLGSIPPNTGLLVIREGPKIYEIRFSGDLNKNSKIILIRKKKT